MSLADTKEFLGGLQAEPCLGQVHRCLSTLRFRASVGKGWPATLRLHSQHRSVVDDSSGRMNPESRVSRDPPEIVANPSGPQRTPRVGTRIYSTYTL